MLQEIPDPVINDLLGRYGELLGEVDQWFMRCLVRHSGLIACHKGCSACCRGLFDITLMDALYLKQGLDLLPTRTREAVVTKSIRRLEEMSHLWPEFAPPWILNHIPEEQWGEMMPEEDETPCPLLSDQGICLVYAHRPMTCRLNGIPLFDVSGEELFDEWCTLNFAGADPVKLEDIRHPFTELFTQELLLFRELTKRIFGVSVNELDTVIPAAIFYGEDLVSSIRPPLST